MQVENILRALADTTRLRIMRLIGTMELAVGEIAQVMGQSQPRVSRHVAILCDAALAERRREGSWIFLRAASGPEGGFSVALRRALDLAEAEDTQFGMVCASDRQKLAAIRATREAQAQDYFATHAETWDELRRLHSADSLVEEALIAALGDGSLGQVLDIGTGTGRIAEILSGRAARLVALDKSPAMLRVARARLQHLGAERVEMIQGDFISLPLAAATMDTVLFHQVLHFAQDPAEALREAARVTRPGGRVAIVDFSAHQREELRERHAHARLGFTDGQMDALLREAGYDPAPAVALEGGELVVKIWVATRLPAARRVA
jgi:ubiquinone/menaquinone biosynthesis C-methylase UbiE/DNA-binding transcriptional ArsR family regulator